MDRDRRFKVAVVGLSTQIVKDYLSEIFYSHTMRLVAVCDMCGESLKDVCEKYVINGYCSVEDLIENEVIDFAIMTTPSLKWCISKIKNKRKSVNA